MHYGFPYKVLYTQYHRCISNHISNTALSLYLNSLSLAHSPGGAEVDQRQRVCLLIIVDCSERLSTDRLHECENIQTVSKSSHCDGKVTNRSVLHMNSSLRILLVGWCSLVVKGIDTQKWQFCHHVLMLMPFKPICYSHFHGAQKEKFSRLSHNIKAVHGHIYTFYHHTS